MDKFETHEYCSKCRTHHLFDEEGQVEPCKDFKKQIIDHDYMVKTIKEIAEQLTRKSHVKDL